MDETINSIGSQNFSVLQNLPGNLLKKIPGLHPQYLWFSMFKIWPRTYISNKFPGDATAAGLRTTLLRASALMKFLWGTKTGKNQAVIAWICLSISKTQVGQPDIVSLQMLCKLKYIVLNYIDRVL